MIRRPTWVILVLFIVTLGAALVFQKVVKDRPVEETPAAAQNETLLNLAENAILYLTIQNAAGQKVAIGRDEAGIWKVTEPEGETDTAAVQSGVSQLTGLRVRANVESSAELVAFGLSRPTYTITIQMNGGEQHVIQVGDVTPTQNGYYVRLNNGATKVVNKYGLDSLLNWFTAPPLQPTPTPEVMEEPQAAPALGEESTPTSQPAP